jgi:hypothetical protein
MPILTRQSLVRCLATICAVVFVAGVSAQGQGVAQNTLSVAERKAGWQLLFNGRDLTGWRASDTAPSPSTFHVENGEIVVHGSRSHLYYVGPVGKHDFNNFELKADIMTWPGANSGVYFHTRWQPEGWPDNGYEVQVNNSHADPKRTAGLYDVKENYDTVAKDNEWFTMTVRVVGKHIVTKVNDRVVVDYVEPRGWKPTADHPGRRVSHGTFALQGHDPGSEIHYRNIKVRKL